MPDWSHSGHRPGVDPKRYPSPLWTYEELRDLRAAVNAEGLELAAIENFEPDHWSDVLLDGPGRFGLTELANAARADLERRVHRALGVAVTGWAALSGGRNNRLFRLEMASGPPLVAKFYRRSPWLDQFYRRSGGDGLTREFGALTLLRERGVDAVPRPYLRSRRHGYAVYSLEPGAQPQASELTAEQMRSLGTLAGRLHAFGPDEAGRDLPPAIDAGFSLADHIAVIRRRLGGVEELVASASSGEPFGALLADLDLPAEIARRIDLATRGLSEREIAASLPRSAWRLNSGDFCGVNLLVDGDRLSVVDWEWAGWDDPARLVVGFLAHAGSEWLAPPAASAFLDAYARGRDLPEAELRRFERARLLLDAFWLAALPGALSPETMAARRFAVPDFDERAAVADVTRRLRERLARPLPS